MSPGGHLGTVGLVGLAGQTGNEAGLLHPLNGEAFQERTIDVTTHSEEPVITKDARVKEEIVVRKEADQRTETLRDNVRRTEVEVEDDRAKAQASTPAAPATRVPPKR